MSFQFARYLLVLIVILSVSKKWVKTAPMNSSPLEFIILHNNDMHARFEQIGVLGNECLPQDIASNKCYGGFARVAHEVRQFREEATRPGGTPVIYLNAGDTYSGTPWFYVYKDNITTEFMNVLHPDAISLGNHEFDDDIEGVLPFLYNATYPILAANLDLSNQPEMAASKNLKPSTIIMVADVKVGIIGYLTPETAHLSLIKSLKFTPEVQAINKQAEKLKQEGVSIIIALGHSGFETDQQIARNCPLVDIVIGGHSNTFLYTGNAPDVEKPEGAYPKLIQQASGKRVPVVQAYAYTKYLGKLHVKFDQEGNLLEWDGNPILLNTKVPQDSDVLQLLAVYKPGIDALQTTVVGYTKVLLDGDDKHCREQECNLGNLIADAFIYVYMTQYQLENDEFWSDTAIAVMQGGGIRSSISRRDDGSITKNDLMTVMPYGNKLVQTRVSGKTLRYMLEFSASKIGKGVGGFLQVSGIHVIYDISEPSMKRVKSVKVLCAECNIPGYSDLEDDKTYGILMTDFVLNGGDGFNITHTGEKLLKVNDLEAVELYLKARSPVFPGVEWRIQFEGRSDPGDGVGHIVASGLLIVVSLLIHLLR